MRTTVTIPDEYYEEMKEDFKKRGFNTLNDYILDLIRRVHVIIKKEQEEE